MTVTQYETPAEILGIVFVVIALVLFLLLGLYLLGSYRRTKQESTLYLSLILLFGFGALISLTFEQVILLSSGVTPEDTPIRKSILEYRGDEIDVFWFAYIFACGAYLTSAFAVLSAAFFTKSFFPHRSKWILIIPTVMLALYVIILIYTPFEYELISSDWQPEHGSDLDPVLWILMFPPMWSVTILFLYLSSNLYRKGVSQWKQTFILAIGAVLLSVGYTIEIINIPDPLVSLFSRFAIMMFPAVAYFGFIPPNSFKKIIGTSK